MKKFLSNTKGVSTVEFSLTIFLYFTVLFMIFEMSRIAVASAYWDLAIAESIRITKNKRATDGDYKKLFETTLNSLRDSHKNSITGFLAASASKPIVKVNYANEVDDLINERFREPKRDSKGNIVDPDGRGAALARYEVTLNYTFSSLFPFIPESWASTVFNREFIMVQEYERSQFQYN